MEELILDEINATPTAITIVTTLLIGGSLLLFAYVLLSILMPNPYKTKKEQNTTVKFLSYIALSSLFTGLIFMVFINNRQAYAMENQQYELIKNENILTIETKSDWLKTTKFTIIGEDKNNIYLKKGQKLYSLSLPQPSTKK